MERVLDSLYPHSPLHETNCKGNTVLHIAASLGYLDVSELLITRAIDQEAEVKRLLLKAQNEEKNTALHLAVKHGHYDIVDLLIRKEPGLTSITNTAGESPLFLAVDRRFLKIALHFVRDILIRFPNAILKADDFGRTPLHYAAYFASLEVVNLFLENNNISLAYKLDKQGMSALHISAKKGHYDVMSAILQKFPFTCELLDNKGRTALHHAVESGSTNAVKILLSSVAFQDLINEQENDEGNTAMHLAAIKRRYKQEVERQITEEQFADQNEGHVKESQRIEAAAKVQGGTGAANNIVDLNKELKKYNFLVMTLITTVTFAAAFQVPGGYDDHGKANLVKSKDFENFLIFDTLSFGSSATSLIIYFATPLIQKMSFLQNIVPPVTALLSTISLSSMILAFCAGVRAVLDEKSSLYSLIRTAIVYSLDIPLFLYGIICYIFIIPLTYWNKSFRQIISTVQIVIIISSSIYFKGARSLST
ncbi:ankyrin repeat-containing protein [Quercus suber]|uniref:Ankyrin repeat-containing protein n=1 Tax=Quercus suber TaxID=58331 RepID=A0AAW0K3D9_QUESU